MPCKLKRILDCLNASPNNKMLLLVKMIEYRGFYHDFIYWATLFHTVNMPDCELADILASYECWPATRWAIDNIDLPLSLKSWDFMVQMGI